MLTWSTATLLLALQVIGVLTALYITWKVFMEDVRWGVFFLLGPGAYWGISHYTGPLIAGLIVLGSQIYYIRKPWIWKNLGRIYIYTVICWVGITAISVRQAGWLPANLMPQKTAPVQQAGEPVAAVEAELPVDGGTIWYRKSGTGTGTPVILLHGGPGAASFYLKVMEDLGSDRPVVRYDQLGGGRSAKVTDTTLFTIPHFVAELDSLRSALGLEKVHLLGHSWGSILALEYYRAHPERVASLTFASPALSSPEWAKNAQKLVATLSDSSQAIIKEREASHDYDAPDYQAAVGEFANRYMFLRPVPEELDSVNKTMGLPVYHYMWGPSEFTVSGTLKTYDATKQLKSIKVPTLFTVGEHDEAGPEIVQKQANRTPGAKFEMIPDAAHIATWDNPEAFLKVVRDFLHAVDNPPAADSTAAAPAPAAAPAKPN